MNTKYKIVLHINWDYLAFSKNMNQIVLCSKQRKCQKSLILENYDFTLKVFFTCPFVNANHCPTYFRHNHQKALVKTLLWVALEYDHTIEKKYFLLQTQ